MKVIRIIIFLIISSSLHSQDTIDNKKKNYFVVNCDYLYNQYLGNREIEFYPGASSKEYSSYLAKNTSGLLASFGYRHFLQNNQSIQLGIGLRYKTFNYLHNDSIVNSNNIALVKHIFSYYNLELPIYYGLHKNRFSLLSGIIIPLITYKYGTEYYEDGTNLKYNSGITWGEIYLSEKIQFRICKKHNLGISIGADLSPKILKGYRGYNINWNGGVIWMMERKKKIKPDDYVQ